MSVPETLWSLCCAHGVYIYVCMYMYTYIYIYMYVCMYISMYVYVYVCVHNAFEAMRDCVDISLDATVTFDS